MEEEAISVMMKCLVGGESDQWEEEVISGSGK